MAENRLGTAACALRIREKRGRVDAATEKEKTSSSSLVDVDDVDDGDPSSILFLSSFLYSYLAHAVIT